MPEGQTTSFATRYRRGLRTSIRNNATAYGYSITASADFAVLSHYTVPPGLKEIYLFIAGAAAAFALVEAVGTAGFKDRQRGEPSNVVALGSALSIFSISLAVGATVGIALLTQGWAAWLLSGFFSSVVLLATVAVEMALARKMEENAGNEEEDEPESKD